MKTLPAWLYRMATAVAVISLVVEFGFDVPAVALTCLHLIDGFIVILFLNSAVANMRTGQGWRERLRRSGLEIVLITLVALHTIWQARAEDAALIRGYVIIAQGYLLLKILLDAIRANQRITASSVRPAVMLVASFLLLIVVGTGLLLMPRCRTNSWTVIDVVFTSTSAVCVTGLSVRDVGENLTGRGQMVLLGLIQIGGLGLVTFAMAITYLQQGTFNIQQKTMMRELLSTQTLGDLGQVLGRVLIITLMVELLGAALLYQMRDDLPPWNRTWWALFHSVSAFCNAGFSLSKDSLIPDSGSPGVLLTIAFLILVGGIGFPVILDILRINAAALPAFRRRVWKPGFVSIERIERLKLHTKLAVASSVVLVIFGAVLFFLSERSYALADRNVAESLLASFFQSVSARTAGFNSLEIGALQVPSLLLIMVLMVIGASPASTGGGVKTTTAAILWLTVRSMMRMRDTVEAYGRSIPRASVNAAVAVIALYSGAAVIVTALLAATQPHLRFIDVLFESISALSTVGLSTGVTAEMNVSGKIILCAAMIVGRVGPLAIVWTILARPPSLRYEYPEEEVVIS